MDKKQSIINQYLLGGKTYRELAGEHGVSRTTINHWVMEFEGRGPAQKTSGKDFLPLAAMQADENKEKLPKEVLELQRLLAQERLRNKLLTAMMDIAEEELKIPIRKKYGPRPLKK
jgi:transposase-like protein